jgi:hypothetical protein
MKTYAIRRKTAWKGPDELGATAELSKQVAASDFPDQIRWIRSYVIDEPDGSLGTICIYEASNPEAIRGHAEKVGMPADEILDVAEVVVVDAD